MSTTANRDLAWVLVWLAASALLFAYPLAPDRPALWVLGALAGGHLVSWYGKLDTGSKLLLGRTAEVLTLAAGALVLVVALVAKPIRWSGLVLGAVLILDSLSKWVGRPGKR